VLLVTAEQIGLLSEYAALARLLQPALVVVEDVDLVARDRTQMRDGCDEVMLNKLLNEMDGLRESADVIFVLTTNRLSALEPALAQRPGRVDQAIEFPLPDADARRRLIALHAGRAPITNDALDDALRRTDGRSPAFIKELLRRAAGLMLDRAGESITQDDIRQAVAGLILPGDTAPT
jgi:ATP-dependent 26S proteasome regulatory subunit